MSPNKFKSICLMEHRAGCFIWLCSSLVCSFFSLHHLNSGDVLAMAFSLSDFKEWTRGFWSGCRSKEKNKHFSNKENSVKTRFKIKIILYVYLFYRYTFIVFVAVWAKRTVFAVWILGVIALVAQKLVGLDVSAFLRRALHPAQSSLLCHQEHSGKPV